MRFRYHNLTKRCFLNARNMFFFIFSLSLWQLHRFGAMLSCTHYRYGLTCWPSMNITCKCVNYLVVIRLLHSWPSVMSTYCFVHRTWIEICFLRIRRKLKKWRGAHCLNHALWCGTWRSVSTPLFFFCLLSNIIVSLLWACQWEKEKKSLSLLMTFLWRWC